MLHGLLRKVMSNEISETDRQYYIRQGLNTLYECLKDLDMHDPQTRRRLDPYVPHLEAVILHYLLLIQTSMTRPSQTSGVG